MIKRIFWVMAVALLLTAVPAGTVLAAPPFDGDQTVETGETVNNDVILFDGDLDIQVDGVVNGDVVLFNGDASLAGAINGDLVLFNGNLEAQETAVINGDCVVLNGNINDDTSRGLGCTNVGGIPTFGALAGLTELGNNFPGRMDDMPGRHNRPPDTGPSFLGGLAGAFASGLLFSLLAFAIVSLAPAHLSQVQAAVRQKPVASGAVGFLTAVSVPTLALFLTLLSALLLLICIGIIGFAVVFAMLAVLAVAMLLGWVAMGGLLGQWLVRRFNRPKMSPALAAALGTFVLTFGLNFFGLIPFVLGEGLVGMIVTFIGLGAVALTKFGTQPYPLVRVVEEDEDKVTAVLNTLPDDE